MKNIAAIDQDKPFIKPTEDDFKGKQLDLFPRILAICRHDPGKRSGCDGQCFFSQTVGYSAG